MNKYKTVVLICLLLLSAPVYARTRRQPTPPPTCVSSCTLTSTQWGAYTDDTDQGMAAFQSKVGKQMTIDPIFWGWDDTFPQTIAGSQGKTLLIYWEPSFGYTAINSGNYDSYIKSFAEGAKAYKFPVILVPFDEFNLNETPYGNTIGGNTPQNFIQAWQHIHNIFTSVGDSNVKFGLDFNNVSIPSVSYSIFYPGSSYVDYIGVDGFDFGRESYESVFGTALAQAQSLGKPVYIMSTGAVDNQVAFIQSLGAQTGIAGWIWFNQAPFTVQSYSTLANIIK